MKASRQDIYRAVIRRRAHEALEEKHRAFGQEHAQASDEELLRYLLGCAEQLGHTPHPKEVIGYPTLIERFGSWQIALRRCGLGDPNTPNVPSGFLIIKQEEERQKELYRLRKNEKKRSAQMKKTKAAKGSKPSAIRAKTTVTENASEETDTLDL